MLKLQIGFILVFSIFISNAFSLDICDLNLLNIEQQNRHYVELLQKNKTKKIKLIKKISGGIDGQDIFYYRGIPAGASFIKGSEIQIARHYSLQKSEVLAAGFLRAGPRPYIVPQAHQRDLYVDLTGIFFTIPEFDPKELWMGFTLATPFIDFKLPDNITVIKLADGNYLIPGPGLKPNWLLDKYRQEAGEGKFSASIKDYLNINSILYDFESPPFSIPVREIQTK